MPGDVRKTNRLPIDYLIPISNKNDRTCDFMAVNVRLNHACQRAGMLPTRTSRLSRSDVGTAETSDYYCQSREPQPSADSQRCLGQTVFILCYCRVKPFHS